MRQCSGTANQNTSAGFEVEAVVPCPDSIVSRVLIGQSGIT